MKRPWQKIGFGSACFDRVHKKYLSAGRTELALPARRLFVQNVIDCMEAIR